MLEHLPTWKRFSGLICKYRELNISTSKERVYQVLGGETPYQVPTAPAYLILFLVDFKRNYYIKQYLQRMRGFIRYPVNHQEDTLFRAQAICQSYGIFKERLLGG